MKTIVRKIDATNPESEIVADAAQVIVAGGLVAFPTETVYGLGANALDSAAVQRIFVAKGRPANNPIIVHVANVEGAQRIVSEWPDRAERLAACLWPGSLTLVLKKQDCVPAIVTAGGTTVAVRVPSNPVALALIRASRTPIAAPSANRSMGISSTRSEHVLMSLDGEIEMILDGGPATGGIESTVVDVRGPRARILRPGLISAGTIEKVLGERITRAEPSRINPSGMLESPGTMERHYAPHTKLVIVDLGAGIEMTRRLKKAGSAVGSLLLKPAKELSIHDVVMPESPESYATRLYHALHSLDALGLDLIVAELPPETDEWLAIRDRLTRAATAN